MSGFRTEFEKREFIQTPYGIIEVVDILPRHPDSPIPVLFAPGWRETPELQEGCLYEVYKWNRRVISCVHNTTLHPVKPFENFPASQVQKARTLLEVLKAKNINKTDVITHSEGAINVTLAAAIEPERFRNLFFIAPAGLAGKDILPRLILGFIHHLYDTRGHFFTYTKVFKKRMYISGLLRTVPFALQEARAMIESDIYPLLVKLKRKGIHMGALLGKKDKIFSPERIHKHIGSDKEIFDVLSIRDGGHELFTHPQEVMRNVKEVFDKLG